MLLQGWGIISKWDHCRDIKQCYFVFAFRRSMCILTLTQPPVSEGTEGRKRGTGIVAAHIVLCPTPGELYTTINPTPTLWAL